MSGISWCKATKAQISNCGQRVLHELLFLSLPIKALTCFCVCYKNTNDYDAVTKYCTDLFWHNLGPRAT